MRFISPSFNQQGWTGSFDLNSIAHGTSPAFSLHAQHPSGTQYAEYLNVLATDAKLDVRLRTEALQIERVDGGFDVHVGTVQDGAAHVDGAQPETLRARFVVWAAGEFQYPREDSGAVPGAGLCVHNSRVRSWASHPGDEHVIIGGCVHSGRSLTCMSPLRPSACLLFCPLVCARSGPLPHTPPAATALLCLHAFTGTRAGWMQPSIWRGRESRPPCLPPPPHGMCRRLTRPASWRPTQQSGFAR